MSELPLTPSPEYKKQRERFQDYSENYELLRGDHQSVRETLGVWDDAFVLEKYLHKTDEMIGVMDGSIVERELAEEIDPKTREPIASKPDTVIWLDKSARPVSWFTDALWEQLAVEGAVKPKDENLNVDRTSIFVRMGYPAKEAEYTKGSSDVDVDKLPSDFIARVRAYFVQGEFTEENFEEEVWNLPTRLDGQEVLIVDEVKNRGGTLKAAYEVLKKAIPEAKFSATYFMTPGTYAMGGNAEEQQQNYVPVWYSKDDAYGRGVGDPSHAYYEHLYEQNPTNENLRKKIASAVLSPPHHNPITFEEIEDKKAAKLKQDIAFMTYGYAEGRIFRQPGASRPLEQLDEIYSAQGVSMGRGEGKTSEYLGRRKEENPLPEIK